MAVWSERVTINVWLSKSGERFSGKGFYTTVDKGRYIIATVDKFFGA